MKTFEECIATETFRKVGFSEEVAISIECRLGWL